MSARLLRIVLITRTLIRQNRLLFGLMLLWPFAMSAIVYAVSRGTPASEDAAAVLEQELFYGLVLVGLAASVGLGTEQRARRSQQVLSRAVSRAEYLLALAASAYVPFTGYVLVWLLNALFFARLLHLGLPLLLPAVLAEFAAGLLICAVGMLCSVLMPQLLAAVITGVVLAVLLGASVHVPGAVFSLFALIFGMQTSAQLPLAGAAQVIIVAVAVLALSCFLFSQRDLKLS